MWGRVCVPGVGGEGGMHLALRVQDPRPHNAALPLPSDRGVHGHARGVGVDEVPVAGAAEPARARAHRLDGAAERRSLAMERVTLWQPAAAVAVAAVVVVVRDRHPPMWIHNWRSRLRSEARLR